MGFACTSAATISASNGSQVALYQHLLMYIHPGQSWHRNPEVDLCRSEYGIALYCTFAHKFIEWAQYFVCLNFTKY